MKAVRIEYGGEAIGAKQDFEETISESTEFSDDISTLKDDTAEYPNFCNPCELYCTALDGKSLAFPDDTEGYNFGLWSDQISDKDGKFAQPITLSAAADALYSSSGITLVFDTANWIFASRIVVQWYRDTKLLSEKTYTPDRPNYFCSNKVEFYNKVVASFAGTNIPNNRLKLYSIVYGLKATWTGRELRNVKVRQQVNPISAEIVINTCDFSLHEQGGIEYFFEERQPLMVYHGDDLIACQFVSSSTRKSLTAWEVSSEDYICYLDATQFYGGVYTDANARDLMQSILDKAGVPYDIAESLNGKTVSGYIPFTSCREALMLVLFAIGAVADTSGTDVVRVFELSEDVKHILPQRRVMQGQTWKKESRVTAVEVYEHQYTQSSESTVLYEAKKAGAGTNIMVAFSEPYWELTITNGTIKESGDNYAIIDANNANCVLRGKKYVHAKILHRRTNPLLLSTDSERIISVDNATLVSRNNIDTVLDMCYNYYTNSSTVSSKIVERPSDIPTKVGDMVSIATEYSGQIVGRIISQSYTLGGGVIVKESEIQ